MLYDVRTYVCRPGTIKAHLAIYEQYGFEVQKQHLGEPLPTCRRRPATSTATSISGPTRMQRIARSGAPRCRRTRGGSTMSSAAREAGYLQSQDNQLMTPVSFFKPK